MVKSNNGNVVEQDVRGKDDGYVYGEPSPKPYTYEDLWRERRKKIFLVGLILFLVGLAVYLFVWGNPSTNQKISLECSKIFGEKNFVLNCTKTTFNQKCSCTPLDCGSANMTISQADCLKMLNARPQ